MLADELRKMQRLHYQLFIKGDRKCIFISYKQSFFSKNLTNSFKNMP